MNYIEGKRAIIITSRNLEKLKYNKESQECQFYDDLGMIFLIKVLECIKTVLIIFQNAII